MKRTTLLLGLAATFLLTHECNGAPSHHVEARSILVNPHIIMGKDVNIEDFPYQISIEVLRFHSCGGAIVSENYVITAAHCVDPGVTGNTWFKRLRVGSTTSIPIIGTGGIIHQIEKTQFHPKWSMKTIDYDVGVIKVYNRFVYEIRVQPILVAPAGEEFLDYSRNATVSGWGLTTPEGMFTAWHLKSVDIPLVHRSRCSDLQAGVGEGVPPITDRMLCAGGTGNGGPCQGDSGGPLVHRGQVVGLASWVIRCNDPTFPTVFTNVLNTEIQAFIKENTGI